MLAQLRCLSLAEQRSVCAQCKGTSHLISVACDDSTALFLMTEERLFAIPFLFGLILLSYYLGGWNDLYSLTLVI